MSQLLTPGLHAGVPEAAYRADPGLNASIIKHGLGEGGSLAAMQAVRAGRVVPETKPQKFGTLFHSLVLEPETFPDKIAIWTGGPKNKGEGSKKRWEAFQAEHKDRRIVDQSEADALAYMRDSVYDHPFARSIVTGKGQRECVAIWADKWGTRCKARIDFLNDELVILADLKSTAFISERLWAREAVKWQYHIQAAWYRFGFEQVIRKAPTFAFVVVESEGQHRCRVFTLPPAAYAVADEAIAGLLPKWAEANRTGEFPGETKYDHNKQADVPIEDTDPTEIEWPAWASQLAPAGVMSDDDVPF